INQTARIQGKSDQLRRRRRHTLMELVQALPQINRALPHHYKPDDIQETFTNRLAIFDGTEQMPPRELANQRRLLGAAFNDLAGQYKGSSDGFCWAVELVDQGAHPTLLPLLDMYLADLFFSTDLVTEISGLVSNDGERLIRLMRLAEGAEMTEDHKRPTKYKMLNIAIARLRLALKRRQLPVLRQHLIAVVNQGLDDLIALEPRDEGVNDALYRMIVETSGRYYRLLEDSDFVQAVTRRFSKHSEIGSNDDIAAARHVATILEQPGLAILYWAILFKHNDDPDLRRFLLAEIRETLEQTVDMMALLPVNMSHQARIARIKAAHDAIARMPAPPEWRRSTLSLIDEAIWQYIEEQRFLSEKPGDPSQFRDQAFRMVDFCMGNLLPPGRTVDHLRQRIERMIRRDQFQQQMLGDIKDPIRAQAAWRAFNQKLIAADFKPVADGLEPVPTASPQALQF
ncbi:MAG: hypothetical protein AAF213_03265, partial [Pseudomonadota bacterium]